MPATALQSQGLVWLVKEGAILESWQPEVIFMDDQVIAVKGLQSQVEIVTSQIAGATDGMQIATIDGQYSEPLAE